LGAVSGNFSVEKSGTGDAATLLVGLGNVDADMGGVDLSDGALALYVARNALGDAGYALVASATAGLSGFAGITMNATAQLRVNAMGQAVDQTIRVGDADIAITYENGNALAELVIASGLLDIDGLGVLSGGLAIRS